MEICHRRPEGNGGPLTNIRDLNWKENFMRNQLWPEASTLLNRDLIYWKVAEKVQRCSTGTQNTQE